jgi:cation diffusion facilitator family transporter
MIGESNRAIYVGIVATLGIAAIKFVAGAVTASSVMLAEGVHSLVDTSDGLLLLLGRHRARRPPDESPPFGHGQELYFWTLIVAILFFSVGGGVSVYEGFHHIFHPEPITDLGWNYAVLGAATLFTLWSLRAAYRAFRRDAEGRGFWQTMRQTRDPTLVTLILEDGADIAGLIIAFLGVYLSTALHEPRLDGLASLIVGVLLAIVAMFLAGQSKRLLLGTGADQQLLRDICAVVQRDPSVGAVHRPVTVHFGPRVILLGLGIEFHPTLPASEVARAIDRLEKLIRESHPVVRYIYLEAESVSRQKDGKTG